MGREGQLRSGLVMVGVSRQSEAVTADTGGLPTLLFGRTMSSVVSCGRPPSLVCGWGCSVCVCVGVGVGVWGGGECVCMCLCVLE